MNNIDSIPPRSSSPEPALENTTAEQEKRKISEALDALLAALQLKNVNEELSDEEYEAKSAIIKKIKESEDPIRGLMLANIEDQITDEEYASIINSLESVPSAEPKAETSSSNESETLIPSTEPNIEISASERKTVGEKIVRGINTAGFYLEDWKSDFFNKAFRGAAKMSGDEQGKITRFFSALSDSYEKDGERARKLIKDIDEGKSHNILNPVFAAKNILKFGRVVGDVVGYTATYPLRYVMMGGMFFARGAEAVKEARFKDQELVGETRNKDIQEAAEEAWSVYEGAKTRAEQSGGKVSAEYLRLAYQEHLPADLLARLKKNAYPESTTGILQQLCQKEVAVFAELLQNKIEKINADDKLSPTEKIKAKDKMLDGQFTSYKKHLKDLDRMVGNFGTVDGWALGAKHVELGAKAVVTGMMVQTLEVSLQRLWDKFIPDILAGFHHEVTDAADTRVTSGRIMSEPAVAGDTKTFEQISGIEIAKSGDSVWKMLGHQLETRLGGKYSSLGESEKTYMIDAFKNKIAENPEFFGLEDMNKIKIGQKIDFSSLFQDKNTLPNIVNCASELTSEQREAIEHHNEILRNWMTEHPKEQLDDTKIRELFQRELPPRAQTKQSPSALGIEKVAGDKDAEPYPYGGIPEQGAFISPFYNDFVTKIQESLSNETKTARLFNLTKDQYDTVKKVPVKQVLESITSPDEARRIYSGEFPNQDLGLPVHDGTEDELEGQIRLAEFIRSLKPSPGMQKLTVKEFLSLAAEMRTRV